MKLETHALSRKIYYHVSFRDTSLSLLPFQTEKKNIFVCSHLGNVFLAFLNFFKKPNNGKCLHILSGDGEKRFPLEQGGRKGARLFERLAL